MSTKKQTGYLVKLETFIPADLADPQMLSKVQDFLDAASKQATIIGGTIERSVLPTRR